MSTSRFNITVRQLGCIFVLALGLTTQAQAAKLPSIGELRARSSNLLETRVAHSRERLILDRDSGEVFIYSKGSRGEFPGEYRIGASREFPETALNLFYRETQNAVAITRSAGQNPRIITLHIEPDGTKRVLTWSDDLTSIYDERVLSPLEYSNSEN